MSREWKAATLAYFAGQEVPKAEDDLTTCSARSHVSKKAPDSDVTKADDGFMRSAPVEEFTGIPSVTIAQRHHCEDGQGRQPVAQCAQRPSGSEP